MGKIYFYGLLLLCVLSSCSSYKQNIMFKVDPEADQLSTPDPTVEHFTIENFDLLELHVFTKNGEVLIDPNNELIERNINNPEVYRPLLYYEVNKTGSAKLPMINEIHLQGLTLKEAEALLQTEYAKYYNQPFVHLNFVNKRVILLGALGSKVIQLENENTRLTEILALSELTDENAKVKNIRVLRKDEVFLIDLSTVQGYLNSDMILKSGDVVYVEPVKRPFTQFLKDNGIVISLLTSIGSLVAVLLSIN